MGKVLAHLQPAYALHQYVHLHLHPWIVSAVALAFALCVDVFACVCMIAAICTCVAFVFTSALHLHLHWHCHAVCFAPVLHLGCTCVRMICPICIAEGDLEESAFALASAHFGVRGHMLLVAIAFSCTCAAVVVQL